MKIDLFSCWNKNWTTVILGSRTPYSVQVAATFSQACVEVSLGRYSKSDPYVGSLLDPAEEIRCDFPNLGIASDVGPDNSNHPYRSQVGTGNVHILFSTLLRAPVHPARCCNLSSGTRCTSDLTDSDPDPASAFLIPAVAFLLSHKYDLHTMAAALW